MNFVGSIGIPDDKFAILRSRDEMSSVSGPMHCIDLGKMTFEGPFRLHR